MVAIAVVGGTGHLGKGIARRLAKAGHSVTLGSRAAEKAETVAAEMNAELGLSLAHGANTDVVQGQDVVIVTVPYENQEATLKQIAPHVGSAILVDTTVPLMPPKVMRVQLPASGCAALEARAHLGPDIRFVSAFHNVAAHILDSEHKVECDVLVFGDDVDARKVIVGLVNDMGLRGLAGGALANSAAAEALTSILIYMNKNYAADGAGIRFTNLTTAPASP
jgi:NADPH-dependent F420 reductase